MRGRGCGCGVAAVRLLRRGYGCGVATAGLRLREGGRVAGGGALCRCLGIRLDDSGDDSGWEGEHGAAGGFCWSASAARVCSPALPQPSRPCVLAPFAANCAVPASSVPYPTTPHRTTPHLVPTALSPATTPYPLLLSSPTQLTQLMRLPELTRLVLSYEGDALTGPWVGDGPPLLDGAGPDPPPPPPPPPAAVVAAAAAAAAAVQLPGHQGQALGGAAAGAAAGAAGAADALPAAGADGGHAHAHAHAHAQAQPGTPTQQLRGRGAAALPLPLAAASTPPAGASASAATAGGGPLLPSWAGPAPYALQYLSLTTSPALHRILRRLDVLLPALNYLSLSSVGEFGAGQRELEAGLMVGAGGRAVACRVCVGQK